MEFASKPQLLQAERLTLGIAPLHKPTSFHICTFCSKKMLHFFYKHLLIEYAIVGVRIHANIIIRLSRTRSTNQSWIGRLIILSWEQAPIPTFLTLLGFFPKKDFPCTINYEFPCIAKGSRRRRHFWANFDIIGSLLARLYWIDPSTGIFPIQLGSEPPRKEGARSASEARSKKQARESKEQG